MAETQRSLAEILTLLADNTQGNISPQDIRDMVISISSVHGKQYFTGSTTETIISTSGTYVKIAGTTIGNLSDPASVNTTSTSNRLVYTGVSTRHFLINATVSLRTTGTNQEVDAKLYYNGIEMVDTEAHVTIKAGGDLATLSIHGDIVMNTNDYIEVWVTNDTSTNNIVVEDLYLFMSGMFQ